MVNLNIENVIIHEKIKKMRLNMMVIKCNECKNPIFKYIKMGRGKVWRCWKDRIIEDNSIIEKDFVKCICGNIVGTDKKSHIKMKQNSFFSSGK